MVVLCKSALIVLLIGFSYETSCLIISSTTRCGAATHGATTILLGFTYWEFIQSRSYIMPKCHPGIVIHMSPSMSQLIFYGRTAGPSEGKTYLAREGSAKQDQPEKVMSYISIFIVA